MKTNKSREKPNKLKTNKNKQQQNKQKMKYDLEERRKKTKNENLMNKLSLSSDQPWGFWLRF